MNRVAIKIHNKTTTSTRLFSSKVKIVCSTKLFQLVDFKALILHITRLKLTLNNNLILYYIIDEKDFTASTCKE